MSSDLPQAGWFDLLLWVLRRRQRFRVSGASMFPMLQPDDEVLVDLRAYSQTLPEIGDIVVCLHPHRPGFRIVKRVAGVNPDRTFNLKGENLFETTDFKSIPFEHILGKVTHRFGDREIS